MQYEVGCIHMNIREVTIHIYFVYVVYERVFTLIYGCYTTYIRIQYNLKCEEGYIQTNVHKAAIYIYIMCVVYE